MNIKAALAQLSKLQGDMPFQIHDFWKHWTYISPSINPATGMRYCAIRINRSILVPEVPTKRTDTIINSAIEKKTVNDRAISPNLLKRKIPPITAIIEMGNGRRNIQAICFKIQKSVSKYPAIYMKKNWKYNKKPDQKQRKSIY